GLAVFIGRFSILGSDGFSMACPEGAATYNQGIGTPGIQQNFATWPTPGPLALMGVACFLRPRRR
ncbi:MAG: hypothetical protein MK085_07400, partial [Phycisphaerales bacterium]|nr:hypothetical protein [Phycisphaerales bacterium]